MKKSLQFFGLVIIFAICFTGYTFSQTAIPSGTARFEALGFNPFIMDAAIDLNNNPAWGNEYNNYAFGDMGRFSSTNAYDTKDSAYRLRDQYLAVNFRVNNKMSLGVVLNRPEGQVFFGSIRAYYEGIGNEAPIVPFKALIALQTSKNVTLGLAPYVAYWNSDASGTNYDISRSTNIWGGTFGIIGRSSASSWSEGTVGVKFNNYEYTNTTGSTTTKYENDGGLELNASYRGWYRMKNSTINLVPYMNFNIMNWEPTRTPALTNTEKTDFWNLFGGVGINFPINNEGMFAGGISGGYRSNSYNLTDTLDGKGLGGVITQKTKNEDIVFPQFNIGLEWNLTDWLQGRFGYARSIFRSKEKITFTDTATAQSELKETFGSNPDQTISVGLGMQFGSFSLDGLIGEKFIQIGPNILSGKNNDLYGVVSMSYNFKK